MTSLSQDSLIFALPEKLLLSRVLNKLHKAVIQKSFVNYVGGCFVSSCYTLCYVLDKVHYNVSQM